MPNKSHVLIASALLAATAMTAGISQANFADDWVNTVQTNTTNAGYYKGAQRGYFTGGSFSARWPQSSDSLLTITPPRIKSGCGGIDMFFGGFSYLDTNHLVKKLQNILAAAPAAAFDLALKTLAPQVSDTIKALEAIIDKLNHLSIDDCKAAKALVATAASPFSGAFGDAFDAQVTAAKADFMASSGLNANWNQSITDLKNAVTGAGPTATGSNLNRDTENAAISACPGILKNLFGGGSVLKQIGDMKGLPQSHTDSIRGFIGDIYVVTPDSNGSFDAIYTPPCGKNTFQSMIDGTAQIMTTEGSCQDAPDANANLTQYVTKQLVAISTSMKNKSEVPPATAAFLQTVPLPVMPALRAAVQTGTEDALIAKLSDILAKGMAYQMMMDMAMRVYQLEDWANHAKSTQKPGPDCQIAMFDKPMQYMDRVVATMGKRMNEAYQEYATASSNMGAIEAIVETMNRFNTISRQSMATNFTPGTAMRAGIRR